MPSPTTMNAARDRLIVALDFRNSSAALAMVDRLDDTCTWVKVGLELYLSAGPSIVHQLRSRGLSVFLDLKLHDIPNTVAGAVKSVANLGASLLTVHAAGGPAMLSAAAEAAATLVDAPRIVAVTVLTSMDAAQLTSIGINADPAAQVSLLASMATNAGVTGLVCSPQEITKLRFELPNNTLLIIPGIRSTEDDKGDQSRTASAAVAIRAGASMLVVGRPITTALDPASAANAILQQITTAL